MIYRACLKTAYVGLFFVCAITFGYSNIYAHGGGAEPSKGKPKARSEATRSTPRVPNVLSFAELTEIMNLKDSPHDVAVIRCTLNGFAKCRGLQIALYDSDQRQILLGNSGGEGVVGFEGLKEGHQYEARIEASKYKGTVILTAGGSWTLDGDRAIE